MIRKYIFCLVLTLILIECSIMAQERAIRPVEENLRQALVIGNANYAHTGVLRNPVNDAKAISSMLRSLGFTVTAITDADQPQMDLAIRKFGEELRGSDAIGLFYYAGHGTQIKGENYLLPVEINPSTEADVRYRGVPVGQLLGQMEEAGNNMNIVILDACRNNPFPRSFRSTDRGLAQVTAPTGSFISYATAPGQVADDGKGDNGLFTSKLLQHMPTPNLKLEEVFKRVRIDVQKESGGEQVPWDASSVTGDFYFNPINDQPTLVPQVVTVSPEKFEPSLNTRFDEFIVALKRGDNSKAGNLLKSIKKENQYDQFTRFLNSKSAESKYEIGMLYFNGKFVEKNNDQSFQWISKAAHQGHAVSQTTLGYFLEKGIGTSRNTAEAISWYTKAADQNEPVALYNLANAHLTGRNLPKNVAVAREFFRKASALGHVQSTTMLRQLEK